MPMSIENHIKLLLHTHTHRQHDYIHMHARVWLCVCVCGSSCVLSAATKPFFYLKALFSDVYLHIKKKQSVKHTIIQCPTRFTDHKVAHCAGPLF